MRFCFSQAFVAEPMETNRLPSASMAKGCIGWSPVIGMPLRIVSGLPVGAASPSFSSVAHDLVVDLGIEPILVEPDAGAAVSALGEGRAEAHIHIGVARAFGVLERDQKPAVMRRVVAVIDAAPSVDIDGAVGRHRELARVTDLVGKDGRAESARQAQVPYRSRDSSALR